MSAKGILPIPATRPTDTICLSVSIPNDAEWIRLFVDHMRGLTRGKTYIKETGSIKDAQAYGWEILDSIVPCGVNEVTPEQIQQIINEISNNIGNGDCMSNCCLNQPVGMV